MTRPVQTRQIETLRQLTTGLLPQIRGQIQRLQMCRNQQELAGQANHLSSLIQQHSGLVLSLLASLEGSCGAVGVGVESGKEPIPVEAPPAMEQEKEYTSLESRLKLLNECREFCLWQIDEMALEIARLNEQLEASQGATRRHMTQVVRLEMALKKTSTD